MGLFEEFKWSITTEKIDASLAKSMELENNPLGDWFIYTKKTMTLTLILEGPLLWWETIWMTDYWGLLFGACFWEMSLLDHNIFQRDQYFLSCKGDLHGRLCQILLAYPEKYFSLQAKDLHRMICRFNM